MNTLETINTRHSYRGRYKQQKIPRTDLKKIAQAGLAAPSGCNKQTTSLIIVDDQEMLKKLHSVIHPPVGESAPAMICVLMKKYMRTEINVLQFRTMQQLLKICCLQ